MRAVHQVLVCGVGVDGGHQATIDAEVVVQDLGDRGQAVGGAGGVRDDVVLRRVVVLVVHAHHDGDVFVLRGRRDDDLLGAGLDVGTCRLGRGETPGRLDDDIDAEIAPWQGSRIALSQHLDLVPISRDGLFVEGDLARETTHGGVVLQQGRQGLVVGEVVGGNDLDVRTLLLGSAVEVTANSAEAIDANLHGHVGISFRDTRA